MSDLQHEPLWGANITPRPGVSPSQLLSTGARQLGVPGAKAQLGVPKVAARQHTFMAEDRHAKRQEDWHAYVADSNQSWRETPDQKPAGAASGHSGGLSPRAAEAHHTVMMRATPHPGEVAAEPFATKPQQAEKKKAPVPGQSPPRGGRPSPARRTGAASPARRTGAASPAQRTSSPSRRKKSPGRQKKAGGGGGTPAPHAPVAYRDVSAFQPATGRSGHGLVSHQALPAEAGMTLVQAVRAGAASGEPGLMVDPASHTATITASMGGQIQELRAALTAEQKSALQAQRAATVSEIALLETLLAERRRDMTALDEALAGLAPVPRTPGKGAASGAKSAGGGGRARPSGRATSPKRRSSSKSRAKSPPRGR